MKAAIQHKNGDPTSPDVLSVVDDAAVPEPAAEQVLVKVSCAWRNVKGLFGVLGPSYKVFLTSTDAPAVTQDMRTLTELVESGALKPLVDARDFELTTAGVGDIVKASMTHRTKGKLVLTVSKQ
jgi:NADPH:quinone reductase-like Zn-dependent oxidoreductase